MVRDNPELEKSVHGTVTRSHTETIDGKQVQVIDDVEFLTGDDDTNLEEKTIRGDANPSTRK